MGLLLDIAWTHIRGRRRQTLISVVGVAMGTGFFIAISALMAGFDADFIERVVDATPHVTVRDEFRVPPRQPAERAYTGGAVALEGTKPKQELRGICRARARMAAIDELPGIDAAPTLNGNTVVCYAGKDISASVFGIEPARERRVSQIEEDMVAGSLESRYGYRSESWDEVNEGLMETLVVRRKIMLSVVSAILLVAGFGIYNVVSTITYEKVRDIAIMKSLGFTEGDVKTIFLLEGLVIGLVGVALGWAMGYGLSAYLDGLEIDMKEFTDATTLPVRYAAIDYLIAAAFALVASSVAGYLPARKAAKLNPVDIIRGTA